MVDDQLPGWRPSEQPNVILHPLQREVLIEEPKVGNSTFPLIFVAREPTERSESIVY